MAEVNSTPAADVAPDPGLATRLIGVVFSPRDAYSAVAARPRALGALMVTVLIMIAANAIFLSSEVGQNALLAQQLNAMKAFGVTVTNDMVQQLEARLPYAVYSTAASFLVGIPLVSAMLAGLLLAIFTAVLGGGATFKQVYAVVAHSTIIGAIAQVFSMPIMYARGEMTSPATLSVFFPMLEETSFFTYLFSAIDLFHVWSLINVSIGVAVLYKRNTGPVAAVLFGIYAVIVVIIAAVRAF
jgi:hypothetical protein